MNITVLYFAKLAEQAQKSQEVLTLDKDAGLQDLYVLLQQQYHFELEPTDLRVAINDEFAKWQDSIKDGDKVVFIPPVAGG